MVLVGIVPHILLRTVAPCNPSPGRGVNWVYDEMVSMIPRIQNYCIALN